MLFVAMMSMSLRIVNRQAQALSLTPTPLYGKVFALSATIDYSAFRANH
jgi:hypothetical protein